jgi:hypothetical protein
MCAVTQERWASPALRKGNLHWPKFYINFRYRDRVSTNDQGIDLPNLAAAVDVAIQSVIELVDECGRRARHALIWGATDPGCCSEHHRALRFG